MLSPRRRPEPPSFLSKLYQPAFLKIFIVVFGQASALFSQALVLDKAWRSLKRSVFVDLLDPGEP